MTQQIPQATTQRPEPELTGVRNFRDVGGIGTADGARVRHGRLFRSGHLAHATAEDTAFLASLNLHTVFDFRNASDIALEGPDVELPGVRNVNMPLSDPAAGADFWKTVRDGDLPALRAALGDGRAADRMTRSYRELMLQRTGEHSRMLELMAEHESVPTLLHCAAGKDRAGTAMAVILLALGVDREAIEAAVDGAHPTAPAGVRSDLIEERTQAALEALSIGAIAVVATVITPNGITTTVQLRMGGVQAVQRTWMRAGRGSFQTHDPEFVTHEDRIGIELAEFADAIDLPVRVANMLPRTSNQHSEARQQAAATVAALKDQEDRHAL